MTDDELKGLFDSLRAETGTARQENSEARRGFEELANRISAENRHYFDVATESTRHEVQLVAEKILMVSEELRRESADIRDEVRRGFADTQAMIKFSHAELDRRVRTLEESHRSLEEAVADLQARVERIESTTH